MKFGTGSVFSAPWKSYKLQIFIKIMAKTKKRITTKKKKKTNRFDH